MSAEVVIEVAEVRKIACPNYIKLICRIEETRQKGDERVLW